MSADIWQEIECPNQGTDIDVYGAEILAIGDVFDCPFCGEKHTATADWPGQTAVPFGGVVTYRPMPKDQASYSLWSFAVCLDGLTRAWRWCISTPPLKTWRTAFNAHAL